jgi:hypothetical protein
MLIVFLAHMLNLNNYKNKITEKFYLATGRHLVINGPIVLKGIFPNINIEAKQVAITNPSNITPGNFISSSRADFSIGLFSLVGGRLHFKQIILDDFTLNLIKNKNLNNWDFAKRDNKEEETKLNLVIDSLSLNKAKISYIDVFKHENTEFGLGNTNISGNLNVGNKPYTIKSNIKINEISLQGLTELQGLKLKIESIMLTGNFTLANKMKVSTLNGEGNIQMGKITLHGFDIHKFNLRTQKVVNDITIFKRLITYTHTIATVKILKNEIDKIQGKKQKNYQDQSDLGQFNGSLTSKNGNFTITKCKLAGPAIDGLCDGTINLNNNKVDLLLQARLLPQNPERKNVINYIYFPYHISSIGNNSTTGFDWGTIAKQITAYYNKK